MAIPLAGLGLLAKGAGAMKGWGGLAALGLGGLTMGMDAAEQLHRKDPMTGESMPGGQNLAGAAGTVAGAGAGGALGLFGGPFAPVTVPLGMWLGGKAGGSASRGTVGAVSNMMEPSALEREIRDGARMNDALREQRMLTIPVSEAEGRSMNRLERDRLEAVAGARQREAQQQALLAAALAGSARPLGDSGFGQALMAATNGLI